MSKKDRKLYNLIVCAIFSALSFAGCFVHITFPSGGFVHLGNFVCIICALLCGALIGGISGALGMGLYDWLIYYHSISAGTIRTFILKFFMGLIVGLTFRYFLRHKINTKRLNLVIFILNLFLLGLMIFLFIKSPISIGNRTLKVNVIVPIFISLLCILYLVVVICSKLFSPIQTTALSAISLGVAFNIFGEIFIKALLYYAFEGKYQTYHQAFIYSITGIPSVIVTSVITVILASLIYYPIYKGTRYYNKYDDIGKYIEE